ncbi:XPA domain containing protein [Nitzschia inconspicua]|uniref:XPA domain containing protein n=2 Tax=Nitzschia inconspicua TaxID=303405 RepID=A0A9K3Q5J0_9STRA|nr:XPA domain containing protein [Nitzschia inconspicua]
MFVLHPDGTTGGAGGGGPGSDSYQKVWFFGKLGLYFGLLHAVSCIEKIMTTLTEEQRERIRINRERALELQLQKKKKREENEMKKTQDSYILDVETLDKKNNEVTTTASPKKKLKMDEEINAVDKDEDSSNIETFEEGASEWVTKKEAMSMYCLPEGTLAVCEYKEQENPHHKSWAPMKLYQRKEIRRLAHARYGGLEGLVKERTARSERRFAKDFGGAKNVFK